MQTLCAVRNVAAMPPLDWMKSQKPPLSSAGLAKEWGMQPSSIWRPATGRKEPSYTIIALFFTRSGGRVSIEDWIALRPPAALKRKGKKVKT